MAAQIDGLGIAYSLAGFVLLWSGYKNASVKDTLTSFLKGQEPAPNPTGPPTIGVAPPESQVTANQTTAADTAIGNASGGPVTASTVTGIENYGVARMVAATYGWASVQEWAALTEVINAESGGNPNAQNASGAYGIAQALGHGEGAATQGTVTNEYGGYGVPDATAKAANSGNATAQLVWMMAYIKSRWGTPLAAWANEQSQHWY
jgi:hypothetical protein